MKSSRLHSMASMISFTTTIFWSPLVVSFKLKNECNC